MLLIEEGLREMQVFDECMSSSSHRWAGESLLPDIAATARVRPLDVRLAILNAIQLIMAR